MFKDINSVSQINCVCALEIILVIHEKYLARTRYKKQMLIMSICKKEVLTFGEFRPL